MRFIAGATTRRSEPFVELRPAPSSRDIANGDGDSLLLADENHQPLATRDAGVGEISLQHRVVLGQDGNDHGGILRAPALVDGGGVGGNQRTIRANSRLSRLSDISTARQRSSDRS